MGRSWKRAPPACGARSPAKVCSDRLLPQPLGPSTTRIEPASTLRFRPRTNTRDSMPISTLRHSNNARRTSFAILPPAYFERRSGAYHDFVEALGFVPAVARQHAAPGHQFRVPLRIQRDLSCIAETLGEARRVVRGVIPVGRTDRVQRFTG